MGQQAVDTGALVQAIQLEPARLEEFLTQNPAVASMLANAHSDMVRAPESNLIAARNTLPEVPFKQLMGLKNGTLEARKGPHSAFEFRLTLRDVQPGQTQKTLEALVAEMNEKFPAMKNCPLSGFKVYLANHGDLPNYEKAGDVVFRCSSLIQGSTCRNRKETITLNGEERISQEALLSKLGLVEQPNGVVRAIAGMFRLAKGFPDKQEYIGTERDQGDVFEGKVARTKQGPSSGSAASYRSGVYDRYWTDFDRALVDVGFVGGLSPELK
jgi:hypothetical protein